MLRDAFNPPKTRHHYSSVQILEHGLRPNPLPVIVGRRPLRPARPIPLPRRWGAPAPPPTAGRRGIAPHRDRTGVPPRGGLPGASPRGGRLATRVRRVAVGGAQSG